ncbi:hypothetical protein BKA82DRAFT_620323 [Pisolithus tinctorius]|uniref:Uncharacterized protein n=1 Tax=Pisolithus tinctorius Marx 270 TaxID=870435 RepID=A0A0C3P771_PISTI|nr:hypothetical protein BKA82DRAFT_620323 [Pisolithus tinctorius]KIO03446.1 hypothetical protein M404DRAFT_620323 [Pisolithus tinctorius Marx 270]
MDLLEDIHEHYSLAHTSLQPHHLSQVHDLLARVFWDGINKRYTALTAYGHLGFGVALLSSPQETNIGYLADRAGWDSPQIATYASPDSLTDWVDTSLHHD